MSHNKVRQGQEKSEPMMDEDMEDCSLAAALPEEQPTNRWSPYQTLTPLGVKLLEAQVRESQSLSIFLRHEVLETLLQNRRSRLFRAQIINKHEP